MALPQTHSFWEESASYDTRPLADLIGKRPASQRLFEKRRFWKSFARLASEAMGSGARGYWDLIREDHAEREFETWSAQIEGHALGRAEERGAVTRPAEDARRGGEPTFALVSAILLVSAGSPADLALGSTCDQPEETWFTRRVFETLLRGIARVDFGYVQADAAYFEPGASTMGFPFTVIAGEGYEYLKPLS